MTYRFENVPVEKIQVGRRIRKDNGDLEALAENIKRRGLINPITVKPDFTLITGFRRLEAVKLLQWTKIPARIVEPETNVNHEEE